MQVLVLPKRTGGGHGCVSVCDSGPHNSKGSPQNLMKFALRLGDDWRMIWVTFGHVRGLDLVSGCGLIYKSGCNLKHHEIVAGVKGRWAFFRFYNSKAVCPGPGPRPDSERALHTASFHRRQFEPFCREESEFIVPRRLKGPNIHAILYFTWWFWISCHTWPVSTQPIKVSSG